MADKLLSYRQAAKLVDLTPPSLVRAEKSGHLSRVEINGRRGFTQASLADWLEYKAHARIERANKELEIARNLRVKA